MRISEAQRRALQEIAKPSGNKPFPHAASVRALIRRGLVNAVDDRRDVFARLVGAYVLQITPAGRLALQQEAG